LRSRAGDAFRPVGVDRHRQPRVTLGSIHIRMRPGMDHDVRRRLGDMTAAVPMRQIKRWKVEQRQLIPVQDLLKIPA
jgi:hypothetical protein